METTVHTNLANSAMQISSEMTLATLSLAVGAISFGEQWWTLGLSIVFPIILYRSESRIGAFFVSLLYHLGASKALAIAAGGFFDENVFLGIIIWIVGNLVCAGVYTCLWSARRELRIITIPIALILLSVPPFGVLGWANPLIAAGVIFPGSGVLGFVYLLGLYACLSTGSYRLAKLFAVLSLWCFFSAPALKIAPIVGISSRFSKTSDNGLGDYNRQSELLENSQDKKGKILLMPEAVVTGGWTEAGQRFWSREKRTVLMGTEIRISRPENVIVNVKTGQTYFQRQPIPFSMWRPFDSDTYNSHWFENPIVSAEGVKVAPLICYEGFLVWPIVHSYLSGGKFIAATGNYWWAKDSQIPQIHESIIKSWSRLFSLPYAMAVNL